MHAVTEVKGNVYFCNFQAAARDCASPGGTRANEGDPGAVTGIGAAPDARAPGVPHSRHTASPFEPEVA